MSPRATLPGGGRGLYRAREEERDQSYFLFATTREQLDVLRFPLGDLHQGGDARGARKFGLSVADKDDSQDICFVPQGRYTDIIEKLMPGAADPGEIVDLDGRVLGRHHGIIHFTVGQRKGLGVAAGYAALRRAARSRDAPRHRRPARRAAHAAYCAARCELDRRGHAR